MIHEIDVDVPVRTAYNQWTQFEDFPLFMDHLTEVSQLDDTHVRFEAKILGLSRSWDAEIIEQTPDQRIAWKATDGTANSGVVTFHPLNDETTRILLQMEMDPDGLIEQIVDKGGFMKDRARQDLKGFKEFIEKRGRATGEYRDTVRRDPHHGAKQRREELEEMNHDQLYEVAQERNLQGRSTMSRGELVDALSPQV